MERCWSLQKRRASPLPSAAAPASAAPAKSGLLADTWTIWRSLSRNTAKERSCCAVPCLETASRKTENVLPWFSTSKTRQETTMTTLLTPAGAAQDFRQQASALRPETRMVIGGKLVDAKSGRRFETTNPANDETLASVPSGDAGDVDLAVASARAAFKAGTWARMDPRARMQVMYRMADLITENALPLGLMDSLNVGKPIAEMISPNGEVAAAALTFRFFGEAIDKIEGTVTTTAANAFHYIVRQPM